MKRHATTDTLPDWNPGEIKDRLRNHPKARQIYGHRNRKQKMLDKRTEKAKDIGT